MANTISANLKSVLIAQEVLNAFKQMFAPLATFSRNFSPDPSFKGNTIQVGYVPAASAAADFAGTYTRQDSTLSAKPVVLNKQKFVSWTLTDLEMISSSISQTETFATQKAYQLALAMYQDILSLVTNANYGTAGLISTAANFDANDVVDLKTVCDTAGMPGAPRALVLAAAHYNALLKDSGIATASSYGSSVAKTDGVIPKISGFTPYESTLIPGNSENLAGFAAYPSGILLANRYLQPGGSSKDGVYRAVTDDDTGLTLGYREWYDNDTGTTVCVLECLYGYALGEASAIKRITTA